LSALSHASIERFYMEEKRHFQVACDVMEQIGGDCMAITPSAEDVGLKALSVDFQKCLDVEVVHLSRLKEWVRQLNINGKVQSNVSQ
jgi:hypothetical protein